MEFTQLLGKTYETGRKLIELKSIQLTEVISSQKELTWSLLYADFNISFWCVYKQKVVRVDMAYETTEKIIQGK